MKAEHLRHIGWQNAVRAWVSRFSPDLADPVVEFFKRAFRLVPYPEQARFGVHATRISLCVGNIWLAALSKRGAIWLLVDEPFRKLELKVVSARSTERYIPLYWLVVASDSIANILQLQEIWDSYAKACVKVLESPISRFCIPANNANKLRLSDLEVGEAG